jgi:hypothetical protein
MYHEIRFLADFFVVACAAEGGAGNMNSMLIADI